MGVINELSENTAENEGEYEAAQKVEKTIDESLELFNDSWKKYQQEFTQ